MHQLLNMTLYLAKIWEFKNDEYKSQKYPWGHTFDIFFLDLFSWKINVSIFEVHASFLYQNSVFLLHYMYKNFFIFEC